MLQITRLESDYADNQRRRFILQVNFQEKLNTFVDFKILADFVFKHLSMSFVMTKHQVMDFNLQISAKIFVFFVLL